MPHQSIERLLTTPSTVAQALLWCGRPVLSVHLGQTSIDLAVLRHPGESQDDEQPWTTSVCPIQSLPSISIETCTDRKHLFKNWKPCVLEQLSRVVHDHNVCGLVVSWPVQKEGWMGKPCGSVLHFLDQLVRDTDIVKPGRPICLWDGHHYHLQEDKFERLSTYCASRSSGAVNDQANDDDDDDDDRHDHCHNSSGDGESRSSCSATGILVYKASQEHYKEEGMEAAAVAADYLETHWPELAGLISASPLSPVPVAAETDDPAPPPRSVVSVGGDRGERERDDIRLEQAQPL